MRQGKLLMEDPWRDPQRERATPNVCATPLLRGEVVQYVWINRTRQENPAELEREKWNVRWYCWAGGWS